MDLAEDQVMPIDDPFSRMAAELALANRRIAEIEKVLANKTIDVKQEFRNVDPDRVAAVFRQDIRQNFAATERSVAELRPSELRDRVAELVAENERLRAAPDHRAEAQRRLIKDAEAYAALLKEHADNLAEQNSELRALLAEALRRHDATPTGEWARAARELLSGTEERAYERQTPPTEPAVKVDE